MNLVAWKKEVRKDYMISPTLFRNLLAPLMFMNLIEFIETEDQFQIELLGQQADE